MTITINYATKIISVSQADLTSVGGNVYELDADAFRNILKGLEDSEDGMAFPQTLRHSTESTLSGVTYARQLEIINGYTITFETTGSPYIVKVTGANHNLGDVTNFDGGMSMIIGNSAGLTVPPVEGVWNHILEGSITAEELMRLMAAALAGKISGADTSTITIRDVSDTKDRIVATVDENGNRTAITTDLD